MAALAVKANSALKMGARAGFCWCGMKKVDPAIEWRSKSPSDETIPMVATGTHSDGGGFVAERRGKSGGRERKSTTRLTPRLSAILEEYRRTSGFLPVRDRRDGHGMLGNYGTVSSETAKIPNWRNLCEMVEKQLKIPCSEHMGTMNEISSYQQADEDRHYRADRCKEDMMK
ncbi:hypothetical protein D5086_008937 [Populus alba]|uniref:Uncharacterized protein n=1 Tax=Populus alba TaxID=43335 RepID=A0ACC4CIE1_POPAL